MAAQKIIGIIGMGSIGTRHAENIQALGHGFVFHDPAKESSFGMDRILAADVDAVIIASPTANHAEHIIACGCGLDKPIFCEKPIADVINPLFSNVQMVGFNLRFHACVKQAKEWMDAGLIGNPLWANFTCAQFNNKPTYQRDGVILNWAHEIDLALYLLGPAQVARSFTRRPDKGPDDMTDITLLHEGLVSSSVHLDYLTKPEIRQSIIVGTNATIIMDLVNRQAWLRAADGEIIDHLQSHETWNDNYVEEMEAFLDRIDGKPTIGCTGQEGLEVLKICLEVRKQAGL